MSGRVILATLLLCACGPKQSGAPQPATAAETTPAADAAAAVETADALWAERDDEAKLKEALDHYAAAAAADPRNRHALLRLTRGWYFWGDAFTFDKEVKIERWAQAMEYGNQCIALNAKIADSLKGGAKEKDAAELAVKTDAPCLYWTATALGKWGKSQSLSKTLKHLPTVKAYITKVESLDPEYYHYGPARYWGAYFSALPSFAGQDFGKSAQYFEASIEGAEYYLPTRVLRAEYLAVGTQDVAMFDQDIKFVLAADPNMKPDADITAENLKDQEKAKRLLDIRHELFDAKAIENASSAE